MIYFLSYKLKGFHIREANIRLSLLPASVTFSSLLGLGKIHSLLPTQITFATEPTQETSQNPNIFFFFFFFSM